MFVRNDLSLVAHQKTIPGGTRTRNPQIRSLMRYPLRHWDSSPLWYAQHAHLTAWRQWCNGNIEASQALAPGSIPGWRTCFCTFHDR